MLGDVVRVAARCCVVLRGAAWCCVVLRYMIVFVINSEETW